MINIWGFIIIYMVSFNSCVNDRSKNSFSWDQAQWISHPDVASCATNRFTYFRNHFEYNGDYEIKAYFKADVPKLQSGWKAAKAKHSNDVSVITHTWLIKRLQQSYIKTTARAFWWTTP